MIENLKTSKIGGFSLLPIIQNEIQDFPIDFCKDSVLNKFFREQWQEYESGLYSKTYKLVSNLKVMA